MIDSPLCLEGEEVELFAVGVAPRAAEENEDPTIRFDFKFSDKSQVKVGREAFIDGAIR